MSKIKNFIPKRKRTKGKGKGKSNIKSLFLTFLLSIAASQNADAQNMTFYHDGTKMNQFTMQETGAGSFQPESEFILYDVLHSSYKKSITATNKNLYRTTTFEASYNQVDLADSIKSRLEERAKVEAINIADRQIDLAWITEQSKIEKAMNTYRNNLSHLAAYGVNREERDDWAMYEKMYSFAIDKTRNAYMANSERQKEFLNIYDEITKRNTLLVKRMRYLKTLQGSRDMLSAHRPIQRRVSENATASYNRWRENAISRNNR